MITSVTVNTVTCSRCQEQATMENNWKLPDNWMSLTLRDDRGEEIEHTHICPVCVEDFTRWFNITN